MEEETKERSLFDTLRAIFPEVDMRILKATVLEGNDLDEAAEFILTEVLEQNSISTSVDKRPLKEFTSDFSEMGGYSSDEDSIEVKSVDHHEVKDQKLSETMSKNTLPSINLGNIEQQPLIDMRSNEPVEGSQQLSIDALGELVDSAKSDKEALVKAIEEMKGMGSAVKEAEAAARQAEKDVMNVGNDIMAEVQVLQFLLDGARDDNERKCSEVFEEKKDLRYESQILQRRLAELKAEKDTALAAVQAMRATLQARMNRANEERLDAVEEKRLKEEKCRVMLAVEEELTAKVAQESRRLDAEEEACTKLRDFLFDRGSIVDSLQGEVSIISEDVEAIRKQLDEGVLFGESSFLNMSGSRSFSDSLSSRLHRSGIRYQSATKGEEGDVNIMDLPTPEVDHASRVLKRIKRYLSPGSDDTDSEVSSYGNELLQFWPRPLPMTPTLFH